MKSDASSNGGKSSKGSLAVEGRDTAHLLQMYRGLVEVSALINSITAFSELLPAVLDVAKRVIRVEAGSLFLAEEDGSLTLAAARGGSTPVDRSRRIVVPRGMGIAGWVFENGKAAIVPDAYADPRFYREADIKTGFHTRSIACVPLQTSGRTLGVLQLLNPEGREAFDEKDGEILGAYGNLAATAIARIQANEVSKRSETLKRELDLAVEIQRSLLPGELPKRRGIRLEARYLPARNVGGDFYDAVDFGGEAVHFALGDVSGKGIPAAIGMARCLSVLRLALRPGQMPDKVMQAWNRPLAARPTGRMFATAALGRINPGTGECDICLAGHPAPLLMRAWGQVELPEIEPGLPLGIEVEAAYTSYHMKLNPGDSLLLFTDGLTESFSPDKEQLDPARIAAMLQQRNPPVQERLDHITDFEEYHRGSGERRDDLTLLMLTRTGEYA